MTPFVYTTVVYINPTTPVEPVEVGGRTYEPTHSPRNIYVAGKLQPDRSFVRSNAIEQDQQWRLKQAAIKKEEERLAAHAAAQAAELQAQEELIRAQKAAEIEAVRQHLADEEEKKKERRFRAAAKPTTPGYSWLALFKEAARQKAALLIGPAPQADKLSDYLLAHSSLKGDGLFTVMSVKDNLVLLPGGKKGVDAIITDIQDDVRCFGGIIEDVPVGVADHTIEALLRRIEQLEAERDTVETPAIEAWQNELDAGSGYCWLRFFRASKRSRLAAMYDPIIKLGELRRIAATEGDLSTDQLTFTYGEQGLHIRASLPGDLFSLRPADWLIKLAQPRACFFEAAEMPVGVSRVAAAMATYASVVAAGTFSRVHAAMSPPALPRQSPRPMSNPETNLSRITGE